MSRDLVFRYLRKLLKHNYSFFVNLPKASIDLMDWKLDDELRVEVDVRKKEIRIYRIKEKVKGGKK